METSNLQSLLQIFKLNLSKVFKSHERRLTIHRHLPRRNLFVPRNSNTPLESWVYTNPPLIGMGSLMNTGKELVFHTSSGKELLGPAVPKSGPNKYKYHTNTQGKNWYFILALGRNCLARLSQKADQINNIRTYHTNTQGKNWYFILALGRNCLARLSQKAVQIYGTVRVHTLYKGIQVTN